MKTKRSAQIPPNKTYGNNTKIKFCNYVLEDCTLTAVMLAEADYNETGLPVHTIRRILNEGGYRAQVP